MKTRKIVIILIAIAACISVTANQTNWVVTHIYKESDFNTNAYNIYLDEEENIWVVYPSEQKDIEKRTVLIEQYTKNKKLLRKFNTKIPYPAYYHIKFEEKKIHTKIVNRSYPYVHFKESTLYLYNPYYEEIVVYDKHMKEQNKIKTSNYFDFQNFQEALKISKNYKSIAQLISWRYGNLFVDNSNNVYLFHSTYHNVDAGYINDEMIIEHDSYFKRFSEDGIETTPQIIAWYEVGGSNLCIYYNPFTNLIYYFGGFDWNLKIYDINFNKITEVDVFEKKKWNNFNDIINYYLTKESYHGASWIVTIYSDKEGNVYIANLNNISILDNKYQPKDVISGYNLKELTDTMIIDEVVKAEGNRMWIKVRRCIKGEHFTSNAVYEMELWEIEKK